MEERTLLRIALTTALIGLVVLWVLPSTPPTEVRGEVAWSNDTLTRLIVLEEVWVEHEQHLQLMEGSCVTLSARPSFSGYTNARLLGIRPPSSRYCQ